MVDNSERTLKLLQEAVNNMQLNLDNLTVLTEAATGNYAVTPVLAAIAGANVIAVTKDSMYGHHTDAIQDVQFYLDKTNLGAQVQFVKQLDNDLINKADIVTNTGFVRPIDKTFLSAMHKKAVISLFCEAWEARQNDVDLQVCHQLNIPVCATNENAKGLKVFDYVGILMIKMILQAELEIYRNNFVIISSDEFGQVIKKYILLNNGKADIVKPNFAKSLFSSADRIDAIIIADYQSKELILDNNGILKPAEIKNAHPEAKIIHLAGIVNQQQLYDSGIPCYPNKDGHAQRMSETFAFLGIKPVIDLHCAGLKVGEVLHKAHQNHKNYKDSILESSKHPFCQPVFIND